MRKAIVVVFVGIISLVNLNGQLVSNYLTSGCNGFKSSPPCSEGVYIKRSANSLTIYGTITANCCGTHYAKIVHKTDSIYITSIDSGMLCYCRCNFCFSITTYAFANDTIVNINGTSYNTKTTPAAPSSISEKKNNIIDIYPNPSQKGSTITVSSDQTDIRSVSISNITGTIIDSFSNGLTKEFVIDTKEYSGGIYFVNVTLSDGRMVVKKIIIE